METTFYTPEARENTRKALEDVLVLAKECLTDQQIWHEFYCVLGINEPPFGGSE